MKKYFLNELDESTDLYFQKYKYIFENVIDYMQLEIFEANEKIVDTYRPITKLYFLVTGKAKVTLVHEDGKRSILHFLKPEEFIGELTLLEIEKQPKDVIAISTCTCLSISLHESKEILLKDEKFLLILSRYIGTKLLERTWFNTKLQNYELKNRLAAYILMSEYNGIYKEKHTETAEFLGVSYRHLLYTLKIFQEEHLIFKLKKGFRIDRENLKILSKIIE